MRLLPLCLATASILLLQTSYGFSEEKDANPLDAVVEESARMAAEDGQDLSKMLSDFIAQRSNTNRYHFFMIYNHHNLIATVKEVRKDVSEAIKACGENNPDLKDALADRFEAWKEMIDPKLEEAQGQVNNMIIAQDYAQESEITDILNASDAVRTYTKNAYEKVPVTSREACTYLLNKMDETESDMISLLNSTLISVPEKMMSLPPEEEEETDQSEDQKAEEL